MTEDETVGWHHRLSGHGFEQTARDSEGEGPSPSQECCSPWDHRVGRDLSTVQQRYFYF